MKEKQKLSGGQKFMYGYAIVTLTLAFILLIAGFMLFLNPQKIIDVYQPLEVLNDNKQVPVGGALHYLFDYEKYVDVHSVKSRYLRCSDGLIYTIPDGLDKLPVGRHTAIVTDVIIPEIIPTGTCELVINQVWKPNVVKTVSDEFLTEPFEVIQ